MTLLRFLVAAMISVAVCGNAFAQADLSVALTGSSDASGGPGSGGSSYTITPGGRAVFSVTVQNNGPAAITSVITTLTFPPATAIQSAFASGGSTCVAGALDGNTTLTCTSPALPAGTSVLIIVSLGLNTDYPWQQGLSAIASVTSVAPDPNPSNNTATVSLYVAPPFGAAVAPTLDAWAIAVLAALLALSATLRMIK